MPIPYEHGYQHRDLPRSGPDRAVGGSPDGDPEAPVLTPNDPNARGGFASMVNQALTDPSPAAMPPAEVEQLVQSNAATWQVDPALIRAVMANKSGFNPKATSKTGAQGLMQLEPDTATSLGVTDAYDPQQNVWGGTRYLRGLLDRFGGDITRPSPPTMRARARSKG